MRPKKTSALTFINGAWSNATVEIGTYANAPSAANSKPSAVTSMRNTVNVMTEWQPIKTAPKDRMIWLYSPEQEFAGSGQFVGMWYPGGYWMDEDDQRDLVKWPPTHWMPLPEAPR
jgi:hypothetical protein